MGRYFFKYTLATIIYKKRKIETNTIFTVAGRWKHVIKNQALSRIMVVKNLETYRLLRQEDSFGYVYKITSGRLSLKYILPSANLAVWIMEMYARYTCCTISHTQRVSVIIRPFPF